MKRLSTNNIKQIEISTNNNIFSLNLFIDSNIIPNLQTLLFDKTL